MLTGILLPGLLIGLSIAGLSAGFLAARAPRPVPPGGGASVNSSPERGSLEKWFGGDETELTRLRSRLTHAGIRGPSALHAFLATKLAVALVLPVAVLLVLSASLPAHRRMPLAVIACTLGYFAPGVWLSSRGQERRTAISRALPDALDLLVTCVEAGQGLDAALRRVAEDVTLSAPELGAELSTTCLECNAGMRRAEAFRRLHERTGVDELKALAVTLSQAERFGTSVGASLRLQASASRTRRMYEAEERAAVVSVRMTVPLILCILPSLLAVILGPAAVNIAETVLKSME